MNKERLAQFHKDNILSVADALFLKHGFERTTIEMIAKASDYSKPTIYAYFLSKEDVFACNLYRQMAAYRDRLTERIAGAGILDAYLACCRETADLHRNFPVYFSGIMGNLNYGNGNISETGRAEIKKLSGEINGMLRGLFAEAEADGTIVADIDAGYAYAYVWSCVVGLVTSPILTAERFENEEKYGEFRDKCFINVISCFLKK